MFPCFRTRLAPVLAALLWAGPVSAQSPLAALAARFAPVLRQDTASDQDYLTRFDFDGDWDGQNNWENQPQFANEAYVYWGAVESQSHVFLTYGFFHPRDWTNINNPLASHENDLEGALLAVEKVGADYQLVAVETVFHREFKRYQVPGGYSVTDGDGTIRLEGERPVIFVEAKGHGAKAWDGSEFPGGDGVVYRHGGVAEVPEHPDDREVSYQLLDFESSLWARRFDIGEHQTFGKSESFAGVEFGYALNGKKYGDHKALAPWGWTAEGLPRGALFFDPAMVMEQHYEVHGPMSREYQPGPFTEGAAARMTRRQSHFISLAGAAEETRWDAQDRPAQ